MRCTILTLVTVVACKGKPPEPPPEPPRPPHDGVVLVQPGTAPLEAVRYHLTRGTTTTSELVWDFTADSDGQRNPMPTLIVELETTVEDVRADGSARLRITVVRTTVRDPDGSAAGSAMLREEAAAMQGVIISETLAPDGRLSDAQLEARTVPDSVRARLDSLSRSLEQVAMQLPAEPVGIGAVWRERKTLPAGGIRAVSETTYTLTSRAPGTIAYTGVGLATGAPQTIEQDGLKVEVTSTRGNSETHGTVDLTRYSPQVTATSTFTTAMNVVAPKGTPGAGPSTVEITMAIQVTPTEPPGAATAPPPAISDAAPSDAGLAAHDARSPDPGSPRRDADRSAPAAPANPAAPADRADHGAHSAP
jgi:hypothetical protein